MSILCVCPPEHGSRYCILGSRSQANNNSYTSFAKSFATVSGLGTGGAERAAAPPLAKI